MPRLSVDEIHAKLVEAMEFNDFEWNRTARAKYITKRRAEGLQRFIYWCPVCDSIQTISTHGNAMSIAIIAATIATFDEYSFLQGDRLPFDNLVPWGEQQIDENPGSRQASDCDDGNRAFDQSGVAPPQNAWRIPHQIGKPSAVVSSQKALVCFEPDRYQRTRY
ncbi:MAG: hypothetical protein MZU97_16355 [Bacillus subtilis]|nr:hypothetical protein [Bacillus subtilis]